MNERLHSTITKLRKNVTDNLFCVLHIHLLHEVSGPCVAVPLHRQRSKDIDSVATYRVRLDYKELACNVVHSKVAYIFTHYSQTLYFHSI
jgi:hypothetical protein